MTVRHVLLGLVSLAVGDVAAAEPVSEAYADLVHRSYVESHAAAGAMHRAIGAFLAEPTPANLDAARRAWFAAREPYGRTEVFRFYGGPIDGVGPDAGLPEGVEGPEGRINAWPLNEAYIDAVKGDPEAGIVNDPAVEIARETLVEKNASEDEADVTTGWHAIEFLLWGQDFSADGPGNRPATDFAKTPENERRRQYLRVATDLLVDDLNGLVEQWEAGPQENYRDVFTALPRDEALSKILTGMATLSGFELASERIAVALDSGDQEDEHSCFSDNTHRDFVANIRGIRNVYEVVVREPLAQADPALNAQLDAKTAETVAMAESLPRPIDRVLASPAGSEGRQQMEGLVEALYEQAELIVKAGEVLGAEVTIAGE